MPIYEIASDGIRPLATTRFAEAGLRERADLQRLLRERIEVVVKDTIALWLDSRGPAGR